MRTQSLRQFIFEPDSTGMNITALCLCAFGGISALSMSLICLLRLAGGFYVPASAYAAAALMSLCLFVYSVYCISTGNVEPLSKLSYPLVAGGFIFGLTALFFLDGGRMGGVPIFFILAVVATPVFLDLWEAIIMVVLVLP